MPALARDGWGGRRKQGWVEGYTFLFGHRGHDLVGADAGCEGAVPGGGGSHDFLGTKGECEMGGRGRKKRGQNMERTGEESASLSSHIKKRTTSPRVSWRTTEARRRWAAAASSAAGVAEAEGEGGGVAWAEEGVGVVSGLVCVYIVSKMPVPPGTCVRVILSPSSTFFKDGWPIARPAPPRTRPPQLSTTPRRLFFSHLLPVTQPPAATHHLHDRQALGDEKVTGVARADGRGLPRAAQAVDGGRQADCDAGGGEAVPGREDRAPAG